MHRVSHPLHAPTKTEKETKNMARKRMVTRTVKAIWVNALLFDKETAEAFNQDFTIVGVTNPDKLEAAVKAKIDPATTAFIEIVDHKTEEHNYGMPEDMFVELATMKDGAEKPIDPSNEEDTETTTEA